MKPSFYIALGILFLSSCKSYQYTQLSSDLKQTSESHYYYIENDSVYIDFDFSGSNYPISIFVANVGSNVLYLDLTRTLFLMNDRIVSTASLPENNTDKPSVDTLDIESADPNIVHIPSGENIKLFYRAYPLSYNKKIRRMSKRQVFEADGTQYILKYKEIPKSVAPLYEISFTFGNSQDFKNAWTESAFFHPSVVFTALESPYYFPLKNPNVTYTHINTAYSEISAGFFVFAIMSIPILLSHSEEQ